MSQIQTIADYEARLVALLPGQFKTGTNWLSLWAALADTVNALQLSEDTIYDLWEARSNITNATGRQLDQWGAVVGLPRQGWSDATYRSRIRVWLQVLRSKGTPNELIRIVSDMTGAAITGVMLWEHYPAGYSLQYTADVYTPDLDLALDTARYAARADPAGVGIGQIINAPTGTFILDSGTYDLDVGLLGVDVAAEAGV